MLLALFIAIILAVAAISLINHVRGEEHREALVSDTFLLLSEGWKRRPAPERLPWLTEMSHRLNLDLSVTKDDAASLTSWDLERLAEHRVVLQGEDNGAHNVQAYRYLDAEQGLLVRGNIARLSEQTVRAAAIILDDLGRQGGASTADLVSELASDFTYPIAVLPFSDLQLNPIELHQVARGEAVLTFYKDSRTLAVYVSAGDQEVIRIGGIPIFDPYPPILLVAIALAIVLLSGCGIYMSLHILETRLQKVEQAASRIAAGHLSTRVHVEGDDFVTRLAQAFNTMTKQVQGLLRTQQELIHAVSHELRTPVARIRFGMQMIEDVVDDPFARKQLKGIDDDIQELDELVDEILTYARLGQETITLHYERVDVIPLIKSVVDGIEVLKPDVNFSVLHRNPDAGFYADVEVRYFQRAIQNLVSNASRYADACVQVSCYMDADSLRVDVEDDGPGIPEEDWERVFTPFSRLDDSRTRASGGYGLGLSIVRRITYWHQGSAQVARSNEYGGARFSLIFPRFRVEMGKSSPES